MSKKLAVEKNRLVICGHGPMKYVVVHVSRTNFYKLSRLLPMSVQMALETSMVNELIIQNPADDFSFLPKNYEFGLYNCSTHHVCNGIRLFNGEITKLNRIGFKIVRFF